MRNTVKKTMVAGVSVLALAGVVAGTAHADARQGKDVGGAKLPAQPRLIHAKDIGPAKHAVQGKEAGRAKLPAQPRLIHAKDVGPAKHPAQGKQLGSVKNAVQGKEMGRVKNAVPGKQLGHVKRPVQPRLVQSKKVLLLLGGIENCTGTGNAAKSADMIAEYSCWERKPGLWELTPHFKQRKDDGPKRLVRGKNEVRVVGDRKDCINDGKDWKWVGAIAGYSCTRDDELPGRWELTPYFMR